MSYARTPGSDTNTVAALFDSFHIMISLRSHNRGILLLLLPFYPPSLFLPILPLSSSLFNPLVTLPNLEQLAEQTGLAASTLDKYETQGCKDYSAFCVAVLAKFYGVTTDYLLGLTEQENHPNAELP